MNGRISRFLRKSSILLLLLLAWTGAVRVFSIPDYVLPQPHAIAATVAEDRNILWGHFLYTLREWAFGLMLSVLIATTLSVAAFSSKIFERYLNRFLIISQAVPYLTIAPLLLLWFGLGSAPKIILILLTCAFPIAQLTLSGLHSARLEYSVLATILRFDGTRALRHLYAPAALPDFFEGVRISVTYAFVSAVLAELIGSEAGLGVYLSRAQAAYRTDRVIAVVLLIVFFSLLCSRIVGFMSSRLLHWKVMRHV